MVHLSQSRRRRVGGLSSLDVAYIACPYSHRMTIFISRHYLLCIFDKIALILSLATVHVHVCNIHTEKQCLSGV